MGEKELLSFLGMAESDTLSNCSTCSGTTGRELRELSW